MLFPGGNRTLRELVLHVGKTFLPYENHAFDGPRDWNDFSVNDVRPGSNPAEVLRWLRLTHATLREQIIHLTDNDLERLRKTP